VLGSLNNLCQVSTLILSDRVESSIGEPPPAAGRLIGSPPDDHRLDVGGSAYFYNCCQVRAQVLRPLREDGDVHSTLKTWRAAAFWRRAAMAAWRCRVDEESLAGDVRLDSEARKTTRREGRGVSPGRMDWNAPSRRYSTHSVFVHDLFVRCGTIREPRQLTVNSMFPSRSARLM